MTSVNIGKDVSEIGVGALSQLSACTTFNVSSENSNFTTDTTGALFDHSKTKLIAFPCGSSATTYEIPDTVTTISYGAFSRAASLKTITIPKSSSLSTIGYGAFAFTTALETVNVIPASVETIGDIPFAQSGVKYIYCADKDTKDRIQNKVTGLLVDVLLTDETPAMDILIELMMARHCLYRPLKMWQRQLFQVKLLVRKQTTLSLGFGKEPLQSVWIGQRQTIAPISGMKR